MVPRETQLKASKCMNKKSKNETSVSCSVHTLRLNRSTIFKNIKLAEICVMEIKSEESLGDNEEPVFVNISVT